MLIAKAPAAPRLTKSLLVSPGPCGSSPSFASFISSLLSTCALAEGTTREPLDEAVEERVVEQREGDARDQDSGHQRLPEEDVTPDQLIRNPGRDRPLGRALGERECVDELVHAEREREDHNGEDPRQRDGK